MFFVCLFLINAFTLQLNSWGVFTLSGLLLLDKPWSQVVSSLLPPGTCLQFFVAHRVQYSHCSSIFIEYTANSRFRSFIVRVLVRWVGGERLTHRLPYISLITLPDMERTGFTGRRVTPTRASNFWVSRNIFQILDMRKFTFFKERFHGGREIRTHDQRPM